MSDVTGQGPSVHQSPATARWTVRHRWGVMGGDETNYYVTRTDGGGLTISKGGTETFEIRREILPEMLAAIAAAGEWSASCPAATTGGAR